MLTGPGNSRTPETSLARDHRPLEVGTATLTLPAVPNLPKDPAPRPRPARPVPRDHATRAGTRRDRSPLSHSAGAPARARGRRKAWEAAEPRGRSARTASRPRGPGGRARAGPP